MEANMSERDENEETPKPNGSDSMTEVDPNERRNRIREAFFNSKPKSEIVELFGQKVEFRQAPLTDTVRSTISPDDPEQAKDPAWSIASMIVKFAYVPHTDIKVFDPGDIPELVKAPFSEELQTISKIISRLVGVDVGDALKNLNPVQIS